MKAEHTMKINGEWYRAGSEIPALADEPKTVAEPKAVEPVEQAEATPEIAENDEAKSEKLTKTKVMVMNVAGLRELGKQHGIENVDDHTGSELKEILINKLGL